MTNVAIRVLGALMTIAAGAAFGFWRANAERARLDGLRCVKNAVSALRSEVLYARNPLENALTVAAERAGRRLSRFFTDVRDGVSGGGDIIGCWAAALSSLPSAGLSEGDAREIGRLGAVLAAGDGELIARGMDALSTYIDTTLETLTPITDKNRRMWRSLGVLGGIGIAVIMF